MNHYLKGNVQVNLDYGTWFHDGDIVVYGSRSSEDIMVAAAELTLYAGAGDDIITLHAFSTNDVIYGEAGNDFIGTTVNTRNPTIYGGAGKDTIRTITDRTYADGGAGNDAIYNNWNAEENRPYDDHYDGSNVVFKYTPGEGHDTIYGFNETSTLDLGGATYTLEESDIDVIITVGKGSILLRGATTLGTLNIDGEEETLEPVWSVKGTTATFGTPNSTKITITGLKSGLKVDDDGYIEGVDFDGDNTIYLSADVLGTTTAKVSGDYYLAFGNEVEESTVETEWKVSGTKATFKRTDTAYFTKSDDGRTINYKAETKGKTLATVSGLRSKLKAVDGVIDGITVDDGTITLSADVLGTSKVTVTGDGYTLALDDDVTTKSESVDAWTVSGTKATLKRTDTAYFTKSEDGRTINYKAETKGKTLATVSGLRKGLKAEDGVIEGIDWDDETITLSDDVLNEKKVTLKGDYVLALGEDVKISELADDPEWKVSGTKATLNVTTSAGYALSDDEKSITFNAKDKTAAVATLTGIKTGLDSEEVYAAIEYDLDEKVVTLSADVLGTSKITVKEKSYTLALDDDYEPTEVEDSWIINGTKATLSDGTSAGYTLSKDARSITYTAAKETGKAKATISGLKKGTTADDLNFDGETITLSADALGTSKVTLKGTGYTLALGDVDPVECEDYNWTFNAKKQTATLKGNATAGYSCDGSTVTYTAAKKNVTIATITGVTNENGLDFDGETIYLTGDSLTDKVTVSGSVAFEFGDDFNDGTTTGSKAADIITINGAGVTINAGKGDDQLTTAGGNIFVYASGDGDDVIADFTEDDRIKVTSGTAKVTADDSDIKVTVGKGTITLTEAAGQTLYLLDKKDNETEHNPYWFIDDNFTTTPQLGDITAEVNSMLGEMDIATDPTQLVQTTPIVTTSDKK